MDISLPTSRTKSDAQPAAKLASTPRAALAATPWLAAVPTGTLNRLAEQSVLHRIAPGSMLFEQAETPAFAQFLLSGSVELLGVHESDETPIEFVRAIDLLLPAAVLNRQPYLLRARVLDGAQLLMVHADAFRREVATDHALCLAVLACEAAQFRRQVKQAKNLRLRSAEERVAGYLLALAEDAAPGEQVRLPLEKRLIASHLGMTRETFSRVLVGMARHRLRVVGDLVIVEDAAIARARFPFDPLIDGPEVITPLSATKA
jgi:CRP/FNR family transcriptional regulator, transcriptional activator FtrB